MKVDEFRYPSNVSMLAKAMRDLYNDLRVQGFSTDSAVNLTASAFKGVVDE